MPAIVRIINFCAIIILFALPAQLFAVNMQCATVGPTGDVTVTWNTTGTSNANFRSWHLYHSTTAAGPFTLLDSVNSFIPATINDPAANAATIPAFYYVSFESNDGSPAVLSDTIRAIGMILNNPGSGFANILWNPTHNPLIATNNPYYLIYREYPAGVFTLLDSVDARTSPTPMTFSDLISICDDTIGYRIDVRDSSGCVSSSILKKDRFHDFQVPAIPVIDSVSVDNLGSATVTWQVSTSPDTWSYIILQNPGPVPIDTVIGHNSLTFNTGLSAQNNSLSFVVIAVDSCNNNSARSGDHSTIFLAISFDLCTQSSNLQWLPYNYWGAPPSYDVLVSVNGGPETVISTTAGLNFNDTNLASGSTFCYRVRARESGGVRSSTSNQVCIIPNYPPPPAFSYLRSVTVTGTDQVEITAFVDPAPAVQGYHLYRASSVAGPFTKVASINITGVSLLSFIDNVPTDQGPYYYYLTTIDSCGYAVINSQVSNTILLTGIAYPDLTNSLSWGGYSLWPTGVDHYNIYRSSGGSTSTTPFVTLSSTSFSFVDSVIGDFYSTGIFCYVIEAVEAPGNPNLFSDTSRSNEICLEQVPIIFIPNAFHPGGSYNEVFMPSNAFVSPEGYSFDIYNRWGENIFHTVDPAAGWDGTYKGNFVEEAVYIYRLVAKNTDGGEIKRVGSVTLIR